MQKSISDISKQPIASDLSMKEWIGIGSSCTMNVNTNPNLDLKRDRTNHGRNATFDNDDYTVTFPDNNNVICVANCVISSKDFKILRF